jgi:hypothetical protein
MAAERRRRAQDATRTALLCEISGEYAAVIGIYFPYVPWAGPKQLSVPSHHTVESIGKADI